MTAPAGKTSLAILGGTPSFSELLHVGRPNLGNIASFEQRVRDIWSRQWLTNDGPLVREFEQALAARLQAPECLAVCNATVGLEIAVRALELTGEVIVPAFTFIASAHCLRWLGIQPVFCDVDPVSHQIDVASVERLITPRTSGILAVHLWGDAAPVEELEQLAARHRLKLLFDSAHALGTTYHSRPLGSRGDAEVFSLHATKFVNSGEGGVITTRDAALAKKIRLLRNFGFAGYDQVASLGTNGKMCEFSAAMGLTSLEAMDQFLHRNRENKREYRRILSGISGLKLVESQHADAANDQYVVVEVDSSEFGLTRDELLAVLKAENVFARRYFFPGCHRSEPYRDEAGCAPIPLPVTERLSERILQFPTGMAVDGIAIDRIGEILDAARRQNTAIKQNLSEGAKRSSLP